MAAAAAATTTVSTTANNGTGSAVSSTMFMLVDTEGYDPATVALIGFLRCEADLADKKAESLRAQATHLAAQFGITDDIQERYEIDPDQLPPLDENGVPKYKGRKRGRKPKLRKRKSNPNRRKRQHTAYTLFVKEIYPDVKVLHPDWPSKDVISIVAKQWATVPAAEKQKWKLRAQATHDSADDEEEEEDDDEVDEEEDEADEEEDGDKGAAAVVGAPVDLQAAVAAAAAAAVEAGFGPDADDTYGVEEEEEDEDAPAPPARRRGRPPKQN